MNEPIYIPDDPASMADVMILAGSGPEPPFDAVTADFLRASHFDLQCRCERGGLLEFASLGRTVPWLYRLTFQTRGYVRRAGGEVTTTNRHVVALRFLHDYLRHADRFAMLRLLEPVGDAFHPNIAANGAICVEVFPGEPLVTICQSLHDLFRWRLRQYDERDALNPAACAWGRENIARPIDDRPLFGQRLHVTWQASAHR
jgi:hypothetical protein